MRKDLFLDDFSDSPKSEHLNCTSNVDDEKSSVPLQTGILDTAFEDNGMPPPFYFLQCRLLVLLSFLYLYATLIPSESCPKRRRNQLAFVYLYILLVFPVLPFA